MPPNHTLAATGVRSARPRSGNRLLAQGATQHDQGSSSIRITQRRSAQFVHYLPGAVSRSPCRDISLRAAVTDGFHQAEPLQRLNIPDGLIPGQILVTLVGGSAKVTYRRGIKRGHHSFVQTGLVDDARHLLPRARRPVESTLNELRLHMMRLEAEPQPFVRIGMWFPR
jgi:hypothetical protein